MLLAHYDSLISQCRSENDLNRVHIAFGNTMTPDEVLHLDDVLFVDGVHAAPPLREDRKFSEDELKRIARVWIEDIRDDLKRVGKREAEPFGRRDLRKSVTLYTDGGSPHDKTLLLTLPGSNHRLMMPIPTFLQNVPAGTVDVLIIRDGTRSDYTEGLEGLAPAVEELGPALSKLVDISSYRRLAGVGVSAGGLPILLVALQLDFDAVLVCGGGSPHDPKWERPGRGSPADTLRKAASDGRTRHITVAFGAQSDPDRKSAADIAECIAVRPFEVAVEGAEVKHNILYPLSIRGLLPAFFAEHLGI